MGKEVYFKKENAEACPHRERIGYSRRTGEISTEYEKGRIYGHLRLR
jgi:hypothetical protein